MSEFRYFSINQLSKLTGKDRGTIASRLSELKPYREDKRGKYFDAWEALSVIYGSENYKGMSKKIEQIEYEIQKEKLSKIRIENDQSLGRLVDIESVAKAVEKEYSYVKLQLKSIPSRLSKLIANESDATKIHEMLMDTINEVLTELVSDVNYVETSKQMRDNNNVREVTPDVEAESSKDATAASET